MRPSRSLARSRVLSIALAALALPAAAQEALAAPIDSNQLDGPRHSITYSTSFIDGTPYEPGGKYGLSFQEVKDQTVLTADPFVKSTIPSVLPEGSTVDFPLGTLIVHVPAGTSTAQDNEPFMVNVTVTAIDGVQLAQPQVQTLHGYLNLVNQGGVGPTWSYGFNGSPAQPSTPNLLVAGAFGNDGLVHNILGPSPWPTAPFSSDAMLPLDAQLLSVTLNTPEPSTWAIFALVGVGAWRASRGRAGRRTS